MTAFQQFQYLQCEIHVTHTVYTACRPCPCTYYIHTRSHALNIGSAHAKQSGFNIKNKIKNSISEVNGFVLNLPWRRAGAPAP